jgi:hypothetical protein
VNSVGLFSSFKGFRRSRVLFETAQGSGGTPDAEDKVTPDWHATSLADLVEQHKHAIATTSKA